MKFTFIQERQNASGASEQLTSEYVQDELIIGRGGRSHLVLPARRLSLEHARFSSQDGNLVVSDMGSLAGVKLNGRVVATAILSPGDELLLGDVLLAVQAVGAEAILVCRSLGLPTEKENDAVKRYMRGADISSYLPSIGALSIAVGVLVAAVWFVLPIATGAFMAWNSGPIANSHKVIENDCQRCHASPFQRVQDRECLACHAVTDHADRFTELAGTHPDLQMRCAECHIDHNGTHGLIQHDARQCVGCHASMTALMKESSIENVSSFADHPQFRASVPSANGKEVARVRVDDAVAARDPNSLKLNHALHLKRGLRGKNGPVQLECSSCHQLASGRVALKPVRFEEHCQSCHAMEFDERLPGVEVPHADSEQVYSFLLAEYTKLLLGKPGADAQPVPQRLLPGDEKHASVVPPGLRPVHDAARIAEAELHTKTACVVCHEVTQKDASAQTHSESRFAVASASAPSDWFPGARFSHGAHDAAKCESCHEKARTSNQTSDLLMPGIATCKECHAQGHESGRVVSGCQGCHAYHESLPLPEQKIRELDELMRSVMR
jgi:hypothetical protein